MRFRIAIALVFAVAVVPGDESSQQDPKLVNLNVVALDNHGQPVNDLTSEDFQVNDAGKQQTIAFFRHNDSKLRQAPPLALNEFSNRTGTEIPHATVILFDLLNEGFGSRGYALTQLVRDLEPMEAADYLYLYMLTVDGRLYPVHGIPGPEGEPRPSGGAPWTRDIKTVMDGAMRMVQRTRPVEIDVAVRVQVTYAAMDALALQLSRLPGRKNIVWISDGVPISLGPMRSDTGDFVDFTPQLRQMSQALDRSGIAIYPVRQVMLGSPDTIGDTSDGAGATHPGAPMGGAGGMGSGGARSGAGPANNAGVGILSASTLNQFASMTGGRPNLSKDIGGAIKLAMNDLRFSYQIGYYPPQQNWDNKFHKLHITCKRKGLRLQAKNGYYAWHDPPGVETREAIDAAIPTAFDAAEVGMRGTLSKDRNDAAKAHLDVRIDTNDVAFSNQGNQYTAQLRLAVIAYLADGQTKDSPIVPLDLKYNAEERDKALKEGISFPYNLPIGQETNKVRMIVFDRGSNAIGSLTIPAKAEAQSKQP